MEWRESGRRSGGEGRMEWRVARERGEWRNGRVEGSVEGRGEERMEWRMSHERWSGGRGELKGECLVKQPNVYTPTPHSNAYTQTPHPNASM